MSDRIGPGPRRLWRGRLALGCAAVLGAGAASWITPPPISPAPATAHVHRQARAPRAAPPRAASGQSGGGLAESSLEVTRWGFRSGSGEDIAAAGHAPAGQPLTLWMTLDGNRAAVERMRARGSIAIEVHWQRQGGTATPGAPDLTTRLTIGHPGLAGRLAAEVRRTGFFEWHSWAEKTSLSPGTWSVSLTYPNGTPLACGDPPAPCRLRITIGQDGPGRGGSAQ